MKKFYLIDDDDSIRMILSNIIEEENIGIVVGEAADGLEGVKKWSFYNPDIIIVDYLMPNLDGSRAMEKIYDQGFKGKFIMLSQVDDPIMKGKAYEEGAMFYLSKPINYIEVKKVLENVSKTIDLENSLSLIQNTLTGLTSLAREAHNPRENNMVMVNEHLEKIMVDLGVAGEAGKKELKEVIVDIINLKGKKYILKDIYANLSTTINARSVEQKIRRLIQKSLQNIAEMGVEDYYDPLFTEYNNTLFDIVEVRKEMDFRLKNSSKRGKVSVKKFIEGIVSILEIRF